MMQCFNTSNYEIKFMYTDSVWETKSIKIKELNTTNSLDLLYKVLYGYTFFPAVIRLHT